MMAQLIKLIRLVQAFGPLWQNIGPEALNIIVEEAIRGHAQVMPTGTVPSDQDTN